MSTTIIQIVDNGANCKYKLSPSTNMLGRRYDNNADFIQVQFPEVEIQSGTTCTMMVEDLQGNVLDHIEVKNNELTPIYNNISQNISVNIGFYFSGDNNYIKNSEYQLFRFCDALKPDGFVPVTPVQSGNIDKLIQQGVIDVRWKEGTNNVLEIVRLDSKNNTELELSPFVQEQSDLAETNTSSETFVKNKSTKYLENEGKDGSSPYATEKYVDEHSVSADAVLYTPQTLTEEQQAQARENIGVTGGEPIAEAIKDNTTQIIPKSGGLKLGGGTATGTRSIAIGEAAQSNTPYGVAIGYNARAGHTSTGGGGIAVSSSYKGAKTSANEAIQLGDGTNSTSNSLQIHDDNVYNFSTHTATFQNLQIDGIDEYPTLSGADAPTTTTVGKVKQFYVETTTPALYYCSSITGTGTTEDPYVYNWTQAGGADEELRNNTVQIVPTSGGVKIGGANSQGSGIAIGRDANTAGGNFQTICIGNDSKSTSGSAAIAIGGHTTANASNAIAVGYMSKSDVQNSIAVGVRAQSKGDGNVVIGNEATGFNWGGTNNMQVVLGAYAHSTAGKAHQIGAGTNSTANSFQVNDDNIYKTNTHTLTVQNIEQEGNPVYGILSGNADPTTETAGVVSQFYLNTTSKKLWQCVATTTQYILNPINNETPGFRGEWNFISNSTNYVGMLWMAGELRYYKSLPLDTSTYDQAYTIEYNEADEIVVNWTNEAYKTITTNEPIPDNDDLKNYLSQYSTQSVIYEWQSVGDETLAKQIQNNEVQIKTSNNGFRAGGAQIDDGYGVAIGNNSSAGSDSGVALGTGANAAFVDCYQIGSGWNTVSGTLQIKDDTIYDVNSHTAIFENIEQDGNPIYGVLQGETDPVETTVGAVGQFYLNTASTALWQCVAITTTTDATTYTWQQVGGSSEKKYLHTINIWFGLIANFGKGNFHLEVISSIKDPIGTKVTDLAKFLYDNEYRSYYVDNSQNKGKGPCNVSVCYANTSATSAAVANSIGFYGALDIAGAYHLYVINNTINGKITTIKINNTIYNMLENLIADTNRTLEVTGAGWSACHDTVVEL